MSCSQETEEVPTKSLNGAFCGVGAFLVGGDQLVGNVLCVEVGEEGRRSFVVEDLDFDLVSKLTEERVCGGIGGAEVWSGSVGKGFDVDVVFYSDPSSALTGNRPGRSEKIASRRKVDECCTVHWSRVSGRSCS